jgi:hypothetical protein
MAVAERAPDGWERHRRESLLRWAGVSPERRLKWLEEARELLRAGRAAQKSPGPPQASPRFRHHEAATRGLRDGMDLDTEHPV